MLHSWYRFSTALKICEKAKIDTEKRVQDLTEKQIVNNSRNN